MTKDYSAGIIGKGTHGGILGVRGSRKISYSVRLVLLLKSVHCFRVGMPRHRTVQYK